MSETMVEWSDGQVLPGLRDALRSLVTTDPDTVWQAPDGDVSEALAVIGHARQLLEVAEVAVVREGIQRGLPKSESWSPHDWVGVSEGRRAPRPAHGHVATVVRLATVGLRVGSGVGEPDAEDAPTGVPAVLTALAEGELSTGKANQLVRFHESVRRVADPGLLEADLGILLGQAKDDIVTSGPQGRVRERVPGLDEKKLAAAITMTARMLRPDQDLADEDEQQKASRSLTSHPGPCGMSRYTLVVEPEGAAILDAAIAALSAPAKGPDGEPDTRTPARRRADALLAVVGRGVSSPGAAPTCDKAQVMVMIGLAALTNDAGRCGACGQTRPTNAFGQSLHPESLSPTGAGPAAGVAGGLGGAGVAGGGHAGGVTATGQVLSPSSVRKLACEGGIIPVILGTEGEPLELGRATRYFTPGQKRALWLRDGGCTFPACTMPAHWSDAHHLDYWSLGGCTDIDNAALLCARHHTKVHTHDLTATVTAHGVTWHL